MKKDVLDNLTHTSHVDVKMDRGKQRITYVTSLYKWLSEQGVGGIAKKIKRY